MDIELIEALFQILNSLKSQTAVLFTQVYVALVGFCRVAIFDWLINAVLTWVLNSSGKAVKVDFLARPGRLPENAVCRRANCVY